MDGDIVAFMAVVVLVFIPALALTARFTLNPLVDAILRLRDGLTGNNVRPSPETEDRLRRIEHDLAEVRTLVADIAEKTRFDRELSGPSGSALAPGETRRSGPDPRSD